MSSLKRTVTPVTHRMHTHSITTLTRIILTVVVIWGDILHGQARRSPMDESGQVRRSPMDVVGQVHRSLRDVGGQTVPSGVGEGGTVPIRISRLFDVDSTQAINPMIDSLDIRLLQIEIAKVEVRTSETGFWSRIIPQVHISASFGMHDIMFVDPTTFTTYILPRDAYRLSVSLSLSELFSSSKHTQAVLELEQLRAEESRLTIKQLQSHKSLEQQLIALQDQAGLLEKEMSLIKELLHFNELRFQQGKIEFDALIHSKLELNSAMRSIMHIHQQEVLIRQRLLSGDSP